MSRHKLVPVILAAALGVSLARHALAVILSVDGSEGSSVRINPHIYGVNVANWAQQYYMKLCEPMLKSAGVTVVRLGATNMERYNWINNRMYNVISKTNQYVPMSWDAFVEWVRNDLNADVFLQVPVFGHVATDEGSLNYSRTQTLEEVTAWVREAGTNVAVWGIGNEPFIAWKLEGYWGERGQGADAESYAYRDGAHGDQVYNEDLAADRYFPRFLEVARAVREGNSNAVIVGPTPANWWLYWSTDYSPFCPATRNNPGTHKDDNGWYIMASAINQWDPRVFPDRGGNPSIVGWEMDEDTGTFNDQRTLNRFAKSVGEYEALTGVRVCDYLDLHRYLNCNQDAVAVQEIRGLYDPDYASYDTETGSCGTKTKLLRRIQNIIDHYNPGMGISLSEYDFFYWQGHPEESQIAALGQADFLGVFARYGVQLACNWYIGEPDQSGGGYHHAADAAKQAMFNEQGEPNPKYWAFRLMSLNFRDRSLQTGCSDPNAFSVYAGLDTTSSQLVIAAFYKGQYFPWWDANNPGGYIEGQGPSNATIVVSNFTMTGIHSIQRFGRNDPYIMHLETGMVSLAANSFTFEFEPLAIYLFRFFGTPTSSPEEPPATFLHVNPARIDFGPYNTGVELIPVENDNHEIVDIVTNLTHGLKISNVRRTGTAWTVSESCEWLDVVGASSGTARVTDVVFLRITNKVAYGVGVYSTDVTVATSEGTVIVPVTMEVIPGAARGELRLFDAETLSLAHTWGATNAGEPYSIGFYDGRGNPADRTPPFVYSLKMDSGEKSPLGGVASLRVDFDRSAGDNSAGRLYSMFGTYGHDEATACWVPAGADPSNYVFKFDIKAKTAGTGFTKTRLLVVITDFNQNKGKPDVGISDFRQSIEIEDDTWQTISIPLGGRFFDWRYPGGQDGSLVNLDFSRIRQIEFCPWVGHEDKKGTIWLDNLRIEIASNHYPVAVVAQSARLIGTNETVSLSGAASHVAGGTIQSYRWFPSTGLSATDQAEVVFTPPGPGVYTFNLEVRSDQEIVSRNPAQAVIRVIPTLMGSRIELFRDANMSDRIGGAASNSLDVYVKLTCSAGGETNAVDFTMAQVSSDDPYGSDGHNDTTPISVLLEETDRDSKVFTGHFRLAAFSDETREQIGASIGASVVVSNAGVSTNFLVGCQSYGHEKMVDHVERGLTALNYLEGAWYAYDDTDSGNLSTIWISATNGGAHHGSLQCAHAWGILEKGATGSVDKLFAGMGTKLTHLSEAQSNAVFDLSSTTGIRGVSFWLKGNGKNLAIVLRSLAITNYDDYVYNITATPTRWRQYHLLFTDFEQEGWGNEAVERDAALRRVNSIQFKFSSRVNHETNEIWIDDVALFGGAVAYSTNVVYRRDNAVSMEGEAGISLQNPSLTNAGGGSLVITGWTLAGNVRGEDWGGNGGDAVFESWNGAGGSIGQIVTNIESNCSYRFSVQMSKSSDYTGSVYLDLVWMTGLGQVLATNSTSDIAGDVTTNNWPLSTHNTGLITAPTGAAQVLIRVRATGVTSGNCKVHDAEVLTDVWPDTGWQNWISGFSVSYTNDAADGRAAAVFTSTNTDWVAGMFVPDVWQTPPHHMTDFASFDGLAIKARRGSEGIPSGHTHARIRLGVVTGETEVARTRWQPVDASEWRDYFLFPKSRFYTVASVDATNLSECQSWNGNWGHIDRVYIYYGPAETNAAPCPIFVDDFRPYSTASFP